MGNIVDKERAIRAVVKQAVEAYASGFSDRHLSDCSQELAKTRNLVVLITYLKRDRFLCIIANNILALNNRTMLSNDINHNLLREPYFWNDICDSNIGYNLVFGEYDKCIERIQNKFSNNLEVCP